MKTTYDDFSGPKVRDDLWRFLEVPLGGSETWSYADPNAETEVGDGIVSVNIDEFTRSHSDVQMLDNPKHLLMSVEEFDLTSGPRSFSVEMSAENIGVSGQDYRDGFAAFNVLDMASARVYDAIATSKHAYAIHERLFVPGVVDRDQAFSHIVHAPLADARIEQAEFHRYTITIDRAEETVIWRVNGVRVYTVRSADIPATVQIGFGIITLHPIENGRSVSVRGQGLHGRWRNFTIA